MLRSARVRDWISENLDGPAELVGGVGEVALWALPFVRGGGEVVPRWDVEVEVIIRFCLRLDTSLVDIETFKTRFASVVRFISRAASASSCQGVREDTENTLKELSLLYFERLHKLSLYWCHQLW